ncbi:hypothetical protein L596_029076 [Steinernema carpocapsae]|uniref:Uncharacterized protein n=1 Tax=Steinernema carpocapsae TaxID=34508 RepID=A0A4U5LTJ9_STECR|nr:hypothetical protein L596_029076 [Steinernema carpocapsae]
MAGCCVGFCEIILTLLFPPLAIWFHAGRCDGHMALNLALLIFFWIPAIIHALWFCFCRDEFAPAPSQITVVRQVIHRY